jgi:uncharacterized Rmd1/YagE family protein
LHLGMEKSVKLSAIRVAAQLDLKDIRNHIDQKAEVDISYELFYETGTDRYEYFFSYGVVVFSNYTESEIATTVEKIKGCLKNPVAWIREDYSILVTGGGDSIEDANGSGMKFEFDHLTVNRFNSKIARTAMSNLAQSVALDHYHQLSDTLLAEVRGFTNNLAATGHLRINRRNMLKFIGRALNTQNDIADNIYIFATPEQVWSDPSLDPIHQGLLKHFDLRVRVSEIEYTLRIIEDNLKVFLQISNQRESNLLEWIIIILILIEILDVFLPQLIK